MRVLLLKPVEVVFNGERIAWPAGEYDFDDAMLTRVRATDADAVAAAVPPEQVVDGDEAAPVADVAAPAMP